jgi:hypothetical protein
MSGITTSEDDFDDDDGMKANIPYTVLVASAADADRLNKGIKHKTKMS